MAAAIGVGRGEGREAERRGGRREETTTQQRRRSSNWSIRQRRRSERKKKNPTSRAMKRTKSTENFTKKGGPLFLRARCFSSLQLAPSPPAPPEEDLSFVPPKKRVGVSMACRNPAPAARAEPTVSAKMTPSTSLTCFWQASSQVCVLLAACFCGLRAEGGFQRSRRSRSRLRVFLRRRPPLLFSLALLSPALSAFSSLSSPLRPPSPSRPLRARRGERRRAWRWESLARATFV